MGLLVPCPLPEWHPAPPEIREACTEARQYCSDHGVDICQLALGWALEDVTVDTVLTGMSTRTVLESNWKVLTEGITDHERKVADDLKSDIFSQLHVTNWKGIELDKYKNDRKAFQNYLLKLNNKDPL
ncbi:L-galactose dehydrogenase [Halotydeus destructor]|nr:L-galactose dehydrogenase [Halotydeus destructor]